LDSNNSYEPNWIEKLYNLISLLNSLNIQINDLSQLQEILNFFQEYSNRNTKNSLGAAGKNSFGSFFLCNQSNVGNNINNNNFYQKHNNIDQTSNNINQNNNINNANQINSDNKQNDNFQNIAHTKYNTNNNNNNNVNDTSKSNINSSEPTIASCYLKDQSQQTNPLSTNNPNNNNNSQNLSLNLINSLLNSLMSNLILNGLSQNTHSTALNSNQNTNTNSNHIFIPSCTNNLNLPNLKNSNAFHQKSEGSEAYLQEKDKYSDHKKDTEINRIPEVCVTKSTNANKNAINESKNLTFESTNHKGKLFTTTSQNYNMQKTEYYNLETLNTSPKNFGDGMLKKKRLILIRKVEKNVNEQGQIKQEEAGEELYGIYCQFFLFNFKRLNFA